MNQTGVWRAGAPPVAAARNGRREDHAGSCERSSRPIELLDPPPAGFAVRRRPNRHRSTPVDSLVSMTQHHPDLADEQAYIDHAYDCLEQSRDGSVAAA